MSELDASTAVERLTLDNSVATEDVDGRNVAHIAPNARVGISSMQTKTVDAYGRASSSNVASKRDAEQSISQSAPQPSSRRQQLDEGPASSSSTSWGGATSTQDAWVLYYTDEGYPYHFNQTTGESIWAEQQEQYQSQAYGQTEYQGALWGANVDDGNYYGAATAPDRSIYGNAVNIKGDDIYSDVDESEEESTNEDDDDDSDEDESDDDDEDDDDDDDDDDEEEEDGDGDQYRAFEDKEGGVMMTPNMEAKFRAFLSTEEGQRALEEEAFRAQSHIDRRAELTARRQIKRSSRQSAKIRAKQRDAGGGPTSWRASLTALFWGRGAEQAAAATTAPKVRGGGSRPSGSKNDAAKWAALATTGVEEGEAGRKRVQFEVDKSWKRRGGGVAIGGVTLDDPDSASASASSDGQISDEDYDSAMEDEDEEATAPLLPSWLSWASISAGVAPLINLAHDSAGYAVRRSSDAMPEIFASTQSAGRSAGAAVVNVVFETIPSALTSISSLALGGGMSSDGDAEMAGGSGGASGADEDVKATPIVPLIETVASEVTTRAAALTTSALSVSARGAYELTYVLLAPVRHVLTQIVEDARKPLSVPVAAAASPPSPSPPPAPTPTLTGLEETASLDIQRQQQPPPPSSPPPLPLPAPKQDNQLSSQSAPPSVPEDVATNDFAKEGADAYVEA